MPDDPRQALLTDLAALKRQAAESLKTTSPVGNDTLAEIRRLKRLAEAQTASARPSAEHSARRMLRTTREAIAASGAPTPRTPFSLDGMRTRHIPEFLTQYSRGAINLDESGTTFLDVGKYGSRHIEKMAERRGRFQSIGTSTPQAADLYHRHAEIAGTLNQARHSPRETLDGIAEGINLLAQHHPQIKQAVDQFGLGNLARSFSKVLPGVQTGKHARTFRTTERLRPEDVLLENGVGGSERTMYYSAGGDEMARFLKRNLRPIVSRQRWSKLLGRKVDLPQDRLAALQGENALEADFGDPDLLFDMTNMLAESPFVATVLQQTQEQAANEAEFQTAFRRAGLAEAQGTGGAAPDLRAGVTPFNLAETLGVLYATPQHQDQTHEDALRAWATSIPGQTTGKAFDLITLGGLSKAAQSSEDLARWSGIGDFIKDAKIAISRHIVNGEGGLALDAITRHADMVAHSPYADRAVVERLYEKRYEAATALDTLLKKASEGRTFVPKSIVNAFGVDSPAFREKLARDVGSLADDEGLALFQISMGALAGVGFAGRQGWLPGSPKKPVVGRPGRNRVSLNAEAGGGLKARWQEKKLLKNERRVYNMVTDADDGALSVLSAEQMTERLGQTLRDLDEIGDPAVASGILDRLESTLRTERLPFGEAEAAAIRTAIDDSRQILDGLPENPGTTREALHAINRKVAPALAQLTPLDFAFVREGVNVTPKGLHAGGSAELARRTREYLETIRDHDPGAGAVPAPRNLLMSAEKHQQILDGLHQQAGRVSENAARVERVRTIFDHLEHTIRNEIDEVERSVVRSTAELESLASQHNDLLGERLQETRNLEAHGGVVARPNPLVSHPIFKAIDEALETNSFKDLLWDEPPLFQKPSAGNPNGAVKAGKLNASLIRKIAPDLLPEFQRLRDGAANGAITPSEYSASVLEMTSQLAREARLWRSRALEPVTVAIEPKGLVSPLADRILEELASATREGRVADVTPEQLAYLNQYHPNAQKLRTNLRTFKRATKPITSEIKGKAKRLDYLKALVDDVRDANGALDAVDLAKQGTRLPFSQGFITQISEYLDDPTITELLPEGKRFVPLNRFASQTELNAKEAFDEALAKVTKEERLLRDGLLTATSYELRNLPPALAMQIGRISLNRINGALNELQFHMDKVAKLTRRAKLKPDMQVAVMKALADPTGEAIRKLPAEAARHVAHEWRRIRSYFVDELAKTGDIDPALIAELHGSGFYSGIRLTSEGRAQVALSRGQYDRFVPDRFAPLRHDPASRAPEIEGPDTGWSVAWKSPEGGRAVLRQRGGFDSPSAAGRWADDNLHPAVREASVNPPPSALEDILNVFPDDLESAGLTVVDALAGAVYRSHMAEVFNGTDLVKTVAQIKGFGFDPAIPKHEIGGDLYLRVDSPLAPPTLKGKFIHKDALHTLANYGHDASWLKALTDGVTDAAEAYSTSGTSGWERYILNTGKAVLRTNKLLATPFSIAKVVMSPATYATGALNNLVMNIPRAAEGFARANPMDHARFARIGLGKGTKQFLLYKAGKLDLDTDPIMKDLITSGVWDAFDRSGHIPDHARRAIDRYTKSVRHLERQITEQDLAVAESQLAGDLEAAAAGEVRLAKLQSQLRKRTRSGMRQFLKEFFGKGWDLGKRKATSAIQAAWDTYQVGSLDFAAKYFSHWHNVNVRGMSRRESLARVAAFTQQIHRVSGPVRRFLSGVSGAVFGGFTADYLRILTNHALEAPQELAADALKLASVNTASIASAGRHPGDFAAAWAAQNGNDPNSIWNYLGAFTSGLMTPFSTPDGVGLYQVDIKHITGVNTLTEAGSLRMQKLADDVLGEAPAPVKTAGHAIAAMATLATGRSPLVNSLLTLATKQDELGQPVRTPEQIGTYFRDMFTPDMTPGIGWRANQIQEAAQAQLPPDERTGPAAISPSTLEPKTIGQILARTFLKVKPVGTSRVHFREALAQYIAEQPNPVEIMRTIHYDDMLSTIAAKRLGHAGVMPDEDDPRLEQLVREWYADPANRAKFAGDTSGVGAEPTEAQIKRQLRNLSRSGIRRTWNNALSVEKMMTFLPTWRIRRLHEDDDFVAELVADVDAKLKNVTLDEDRIEELERWKTETFTTLIPASSELKDTWGKQFDAWIKTAKRKARIRKARRLGIIR